MLVDPGHHSARLAPVIDFIRERGCPAQICVSLRGEIVLDDAYGCVNRRMGAAHMAAVSDAVLAAVS